MNVVPVQHREIIRLRLLGPSGCSFSNWPFLQCRARPFSGIPNNASHAAYLDEWKAVAQLLGVEMLFVAVRSSDEFDTAFAAMMREPPDAFTMTADSLHQLHIGWIIDFLARNRLPGAYQVRENVVAGGLMSYGASMPDLFRHAASFVHKILQGTRPADLPVEQPTKFDLAVNLKTAKALGLTIPEPFLLLADEVIE